MLAGEHQLEQRGVADGEAEVGPGEREQARVERRLAAASMAGQSRPAARSRPGERVEQGLLVREVPARRGVADTDFAGELAQRQRAGAPLRSVPSARASRAARRSPWW